MGATQEQWLRGGSNGDDRLSEEGPDTDGTKHFIYISSLNRPDLPIAQVQAANTPMSPAGQWQFWGLNPDVSAHFPASPVPLPWKGIESGGPREATQSTPVVLLKRKPRPDWGCGLPSQTRPDSDEPPFNP